MRNTSAWRDDMPPDWRELTAQRYPEIAKDPEKAVRG